MPEVSVVIPSYNHAPYIAGTVQSVLNQTLKDLEIIIIDDGSQDDSLRIVRSFNDSRIKIFTQPNQGAHATINRGLSIASANLMAILNSDDQYHVERLEKIVQEFKKIPQAGLIGSYLEIIDENGKQTGIKQGYHNCEPWLLENPERSFRAGENLSDALLTENFWATTSNFVFTRQAYEAVGPFRPLRYSHDWDFALRLSRQFPTEIIPESLVRYRVHPKNTIRENQAAMIFEICWILAVHLPEKIRGEEKPLNEQLLDQLLHSIYTYDCDRVLTVLLLQELVNHQMIALELLDVNNPSRRIYQNYIEHRLAGINSQLAHNAESISYTRKLYLEIRRYMRPLKKAWLRLKKKNLP